MKIMIKFFSVHLLLLFSLARAETSSKTYNFIAWDSPPYVTIYDRDKLEGIFVEIVNSVCKKLNANCNIEIIPYRRLTNQIQIGSFLGAFPLTKTAERFDNYLFSIPIVNCKLGIFVRKDNSDIVTESNHRKVLNNYIISSFGPSITFSKLENIAKYTPNLELFMDVKIETSFIKLNVNHIESSSKEKKSGIFVDKKIGENIIKKNNLENIRYAGDISSFDYYIMFKKENTDLIFVKKFKEMLSKMKNNGEINRILSNY